MTTAGTQGAQLLCAFQGCVEPVANVFVCSAGGECEVRDMSREAQMLVELVLRHPSTMTLKQLASVFTGHTKAAKLART